MNTRRNDITSSQPASPPLLSFPAHPPNSSSFIQRSISRNRIQSGAQSVNGAGLSFLSVEGKKLAHLLSFPCLSVLNHSNFFFVFRGQGKFGL